MRATCENCGQVQPPDWKPGDLCGQCGHVVRREKRCHWCVQLTPNGNYCRQCGSGLVPDEQYGAARWLKHLGSDQFVIPERLAAMPAEQVGHFDRLYQRHAIVAERHIDDIARAESHLRHRGWARLLETELLQRLPLPDDQLQALTLPPAEGITEDEKLREIRFGSPFGLTQTLAALARLRLWTQAPTAYNPDYGPDMELARQARHLPDTALSQEAAALLSHWHFTLNLGISLGYYTRESALAASYGQFPVEAALGLSLLTDAHDSVVEPAPLQALGSEEGDLAFGAALASQRPEPLRAALRNPGRQFAAATVLLRMNEEFAFGPLLANFNDDQLYFLFDIMVTRRMARPDMNAYLRPLLNRQAAMRFDMRHMLYKVRVLNLQPGDARQLLADAPHVAYTTAPNWKFIESILTAPALPPDERLQLLQELIAQDLFTLKELPALRALNEHQALPISLVTEHLRMAPELSREGLLEISAQLLRTAPQAEALRLHTFLRGVSWDAGLLTQLQHSAYHVLKRWYEGSYEDKGSRLRFTQHGAAMYFGSAQAFVEYLVTGFERLDELDARWAEYNIFLLSDHARYVRQDLMALLETTGQDLDDDAGNAAGRSALLALLAPLPLPLINRLRTVLRQAAQDTKAAERGRQDAVLLLGHLSHYAPWREAARADLAALLAGTDSHSSIGYLLEQALADES